MVDTIHVISDDLHTAPIPPKIHSIQDFAVVPCIWRTSTSEFWSMHIVVGMQFFHNIFFSPLSLRLLSILIGVCVFSISYEAIDIPFNLYIVYIESPAVSRRATCMMIKIKYIEFHYDPYCLRNILNKTFLFRRNWLLMIQYIGGFI